MDEGVVIAITDRLDELRKTGFIQSLLTLLAVLKCNLARAPVKNVLPAGRLNEYGFVSASSSINGLAIPRGHGINDMVVSLPVDRPLIPRWHEKPDESLTGYTAIAGHSHCHGYLDRSPLPATRGRAALARQDPGFILIQWLKRQLKERWDILFKRSIALRSPHLSMLQSRSHCFLRNDALAENRFLAVTVRPLKFINIPTVFPSVTETAPPSESARYLYRQDYPTLVPQVGNLSPHLKEARY